MPAMRHGIVIDKQMLFNRVLRSLSRHTVSINRTIRYTRAKRKSGSLTDPENKTIHSEVFIRVYEEKRARPYAHKYCEIPLVSFRFVRIQTYRDLRRILEQLITFVTYRGNQWHDIWHMRENTREVWTLRKQFFTIVPSSLPSSWQH